MVTPRIHTGQILPDVELGRLADDWPVGVRLREVIGRDLAIVFGAPGAFTPICTREHVPDFIAQAAEFRASGFARIVCVTPNDPWVNAAWQAQVDPTAELQILSDGNLAFAEALGAVSESPDLFMGRRPHRYLIVARDGFVQRLTIEADPIVLTCTRARDLPKAA